MPCVGTLILRTSGHQQHNVNLQKGDSTAVCRPRSSMIKSIVRTLIVETSEYQQHNVNLKKGDLATMCRPCSLMIKSAQDGEEEAENLHSWNCSFFPLVGDLLDL